MAQIFVKFRRQNTVLKNPCLPMESVEGFSHMVPGLVFGNVPQWIPTQLLSISGEVGPNKKRYRAKQQRTRVNRKKMKNGIYIITQVASYTFARIKSKS